MQLIEYKNWEWAEGEVLGACYYEGLIISLGLDLIIFFLKITNEGQF